MSDREKRHLVGLESVPESLRRCALTIGNFDGVHCGHRKLLACARALADAEGEAVVALTFDPPPDRVVRPDDQPQRISHHEETVELLVEAGCDCVVTVRTTPNLLAMPPEAFLREIVLGRFAPRHVVEGPNFFFGRDRAGTIATLQETGRRAGFVVHVVEPVCVELDGAPMRVSSTLLRRLILEGRVDLAAEWLTRPFTLSGAVVHGLHRGRTLRFPTANLDRGEQIVPADGVYAGRTALDGKTYPTAISIGCKPTFGETEQAIEAHLIGASGDFYDRRIRVAFLRRLREQVKFASAEALIEQIDRDVKQTKGLMDRVE